MMWPKAEGTTRAFEKNLENCTEFTSRYIILNVRIRLSSLRYIIPTRLSHYEVFETAYFLILALFCLLGPFYTCCQYPFCA